ncbi:MAG: YceI family protein [Asticcacaulis sp.]
MPRPPPRPSVAGIPAGDYKADPAHTSLTFEVSHMGYSHYTARFADVQATLRLDPAHPETAQRHRHHRSAVPGAQHSAQGLP